ncbi:MULTISPECIES: hypothetical protein [unclassified Halomonas]|uniref:hypothetical protein n=1 Tax=unclassified Halomonas TaxID=2609666 RepID=UPI0024689ECC|nr:MULTISPECIES: hypothetical protein [unclassified Halomonas]
MAQVINIPSLEALQDQLERLERPDWVQGIELTEELDADGDMALWAWIVLEPEFPPQEELQPALTELRHRIRKLLSKEVPGLWAYVRVRESEAGDV